MGCFRGRRWRSYSAEKGLVGWTVLLVRAKEEVKILNHATSHGFVTY